MTPSRSSTGQTSDLPAIPPQETQRASLDHGEHTPEIVRSNHDEELKEGKTLPMHDPEDLIGCTFLAQPEEDGQQFHMKIIEAVTDNQ